MFHLGRHSADPELWGAGADALLEILETLRRLWNGWTPRELDLGGGYPAPRDPFGRLLTMRAEAPARAPEVADYAQAICPRLVTGLAELGIAADGIQLEVEPGRALYADAGVHLATVGNIKRQTSPVALTWVETDSSDAYLADVNLEHNRWTCLAAANAAAEPDLLADVTGRTCALDVIVADAGAAGGRGRRRLGLSRYGRLPGCKREQLNALPRPGTVLVSGATAELIRRHETVDDVFARDLIPQHLEDGEGGASGDEHWRATGLEPCPR